MCLMSLIVCRSINYVSIYSALLILLISSGYTEVAYICRWLPFELVVKPALTFITLCFCNYLSTSELTLQYLKMSRG